MLFLPECQNVCCEQRLFCDALSPDGDIDSHRIASPVVVCAHNVRCVKSAVPVLLECVSTADSMKNVRPFDLCGLIMLVCPPVVSKAILISVLLCEFRLPAG